MEKAQETTPEATNNDVANETSSMDEINTPDDESSEVMDESILLEDEYKAMCQSLWYDDIFFSEDDLEGEYVKLDLFVEEWRYFNEDAAYNVFASDFIDKYNLQREFYKCGVQHESEFSYVGSQITMYFSNDNEYSAADMSEGDHLIVYGEIIEYSTLSINGYNTCSIIPKYIENNGQ